MGSGFKTFTAGAVLTASEVNNYLMEQAIPVFATTAARDAAITAPEEGMTAYVTGTKLTYVYTGAAWFSNAGSVLQTVTTHLPGIYTHSTNIALSAITGLSVAITPRSTVSKILVSFNILVSGSQSLIIYGNLRRGATNIAQPTTGAMFTGTYNSSIGGSSDFGHPSLSFLDSPATAAAVTYSLTIGCNTATCYVNRRGDSADYTGTSSITVQEIAVSL